MPSGVWRGVVRKIQNGKPYVEIERLAKGFQYGPCMIAEGTWTPGMTTNTAQTTVSAGEPAHTHALAPEVAPLAVGDRVIIAFIEGRQDDVVVLARVSA